MFRILTWLTMTIALLAPMVSMADTVQSLVVEQAPDEKSRPTANPDSPPLNLELTAEDIAWMMTQVKIEPETADDTGTVEVRERLGKPGPDVPGGIGSLFWAVKHPLQAWRIFTPVQ